MIQLESYFPLQLNVSLTLERKKKKTIIQLKSQYPITPYNLWLTNYSPFNRDSPDIHS